MIRLSCFLFLLLTFVSAPTRLNAGPKTYEIEFGGVLLGPSGSASAVGPTGLNDDFTNRSIGADVVTSVGSVTAASASVIFKNTVKNTGNGDDAFIITAPLIPQGFRVEGSVDHGDSYRPIDGSTNSMTVAVAYRAAVVILFRITAPAGLPGLKAFDTTLRATSTISPSLTNETINRIYTGFIRLDNTHLIVNRTGVGGPADAVPGAEVEFVVTYSNISSTNGVGCSLLTAYNIVINANGKIAPNNWGETTDHVVGARDDRGGYIVGDRPNSHSLTNIVMRLEAGQSGVFRFKRLVR